MGSQQHKRDLCCASFASFEITDEYYFLTIPAVAETLPAERKADYLLAASCYFGLRGVIMYPQFVDSDSDSPLDSQMVYFIVTRLSFTANLFSFISNNLNKLFKKKSKNGEKKTKEEILEKKCTAERLRYKKNENNFQEFTGGNEKKVVKV